MYANAIRWVAVYEMCQCAFGMYHVCVVWHHVPTTDFADTSKQLYICIIVCTCLCVLCVCVCVNACVHWRAQQDPYGIFLCVYVFVWECQCVCMSSFYVREPRRWSPNVTFVPVTTLCVRVWVCVYKWFCIFHTFFVACGSVCVCVCVCWRVRCVRVYVWACFYEYLYAHGWKCILWVGVSVAWNSVCIMCVSVAVKVHKLLYGLSWDRVKRAVVPVSVYGCRALVFC